MRLSRAAACRQRPSSKVGKTPSSPLSCSLAVHWRTGILRLSALPNPSWIEHLPFRIYPPSQQSIRRDVVARILLQGGQTDLFQSFPIPPRLLQPQVLPLLQAHGVQHRRVRLLSNTQRRRIRFLGKRITKLCE